MLIFAKFKNKRCYLKKNTPLWVENFSIQYNCIFLTLRNKILDLFLNGKTSKKATTTTKNTSHMFAADNILQEVMDAKPGFKVFRRTPN